MIITRLSGGFGNQMFQYAAGIGLAERLDSNLVADTGWFQAQDSLGVITRRSFELDIFGIEPGRSTQLQKIQLKLNPPIILKERLGNSSVYDRRVEKLSGNVVLDGYWQSYRYFSAAETRVRSIFKFPMLESSKNKGLLDEVASTNSISVHVRRGDYANDKQTKATYNSLGSAYYMKAIDIIESKGEKITPFIFSDDINWCKANLKLRSAIYVSQNTGKKSYEDMRLMMTCRHNIIANSSFSWWGAWLNKNPSKIVIAPKKWFADPKILTNDLIPTTWQRI